MNGKKAKRLRKRAKELLVEWLYSIIPEDQATEEINTANIEQYLSKQTHVYLQRKFLLSAFSVRWMYKRVKRNPSLTLEQLNKDLEKENTKVNVWN